MSKLTFSEVYKDDFMGHCRKVFKGDEHIAYITAEWDLVDTIFPLSPDVMKEIVNAVDEATEEQQEA